ncbi:protein NipSnap homolog 3B-like isoform X1 [Peromyscus leucopus]|uniref:protein NipSnap homolog 3B-like isoform X1 n=1 Tax=Peromyscus leucopus TaxID=10041 RepID=UPI001884BCE6|nr:protein NipSnap homolog 3B-like isoform X1 [Peromyscus leucopus]
MLALRSGLRKVLAPWALAPQVCSSFATGRRQTEGTFYEFCTYYLKPSKMKEFMKNFKKNVHLRTAHSELVGYWSVELGGRINRVFHIWKYDNFAHRTAVFKALASDPEWHERFLIPNLASIDKQESEIVYLVPWCKMGTPPKEGVYELATFLMKPGGPALWGDPFERAVTAHAKQGYTELIGVFHTEYGKLNRDGRSRAQYQIQSKPKIQLYKKVQCLTSVIYSWMDCLDFKGPWRLHFSSFANLRTHSLPPRLSLLCSTAAVSHYPGISNVLSPLLQLRLHPHQ